MPLYIKAGIVGGRAEEGHHAVHNDGQADTQGCGRRNGGKQRVDHIHPDQAEAPDADTPGNVTAADKDLSLTDLVGQRADQHRGHSSRHSRGRHHSGDGFSRSVEHFVDEYVEIHILHHPGHLARQAENY